jgi:D-inositol-3-phosphate glycosyltransferase
MKDKIKLMVWGDAVVPTGFSRVLHAVTKYLPDAVYQISWLGINYYGDPHEYPYRIYPASTRGDLWGINRLKEVIAKEQPDLIFLLNDIWVINRVLNEIKDIKPLPKIVAYFPVDGTDFNKEWFKDFGIIDRTVVYTDFGKRVVEACGAKNLKIDVIPHGTDTGIFYPINRPKSEIKKLVYPNTAEFIDSFIVLNANRNQPRKRIDIFLEAFKLFSENKPENVKAYCHMGLRDAGWDISDLAVRYGIDKKLIITNNSPTLQTVSVEKLNVIYNATDVGINTGIGEGWGLTNTEHVVTGAPQIVGNHSACAELFSDCGIVVPAPVKIVDSGINITHYASRIEDMAEAMETLYTNKELYNELAKKGFEKFANEKYSWKTIAKQWDTIFQEVLD